MVDWKMSFHIRETSRWDSGLRRRVYNKVPTVECRAKYGLANVLITVRPTETLVSMNCAATISPADLDEIQRIMLEAKDMLKEKMNGTS